MVDFEELWAYIEKLLLVLKKKPVSFKTSQCFLANICYEMSQLRDVKSVHNIIWYELSSLIRHEIVQNFWKTCEVNALFMRRIHVNAPVYKALPPLDIQRLFYEYIEVVEKMMDSFKNLKDFCCRLQNVLEKNNYKDIWTLNHSLKVQEILSEQLLANLPSNFVYVVQAFHYISFKVFENMHEKQNLDRANRSGICEGCQSNECNCYQQSILINDINKKMRDMGLLERVAGQTINNLIQLSINDQIFKTCSGVFDKRNLTHLEMWIDNVVCNWLTQTFCATISGSLPEPTDNTEKFNIKLKYFLYESFANCVIDQFFTIIIEFPDSSPAIEDLKLCMEKIDIRKRLIASLKSSLEKKILHAGVNTIDILTGYIATIKTVRYLDKSGVILSTVTVPIKEYLKKRNDTVRRVVTGLTEDGPTDLSEELAKGETNKKCHTKKNHTEIMEWENWTPEPSGLENVYYADILASNRAADIISMIVDIYGSKELFMNEYRNLMADRLLNQLDFNPEREIRNLELLKIRFGESLLHSCEVMLKDVTDSKRINAHIQSDSSYNEAKLFDISSLIISAQFWPPFNKECLDLPEEIAAEFHKYISSYEAYKGNRTLQFRHVTGRVNIVVDIGYRSVELVVPPTQAIIIYHFQFKNEWSLEDLSNLMKVPQTILRRRIAYWQQNGIICEASPDIYKLVEETRRELQCTSENSLQVLSDEDGMESAMASASEQREEELQVFWSYIVGMLTNLDSLPLERIHQMLKLFASQGIGTEFSLEELKDFLQRKVREHKLIYSGGVYQLTK